MKILVTYTDEDLETCPGDTEARKFVNFVYHVISTINKGERFGVHLPKYDIQFEKQS